MYKDRQSALGLLASGVGVDKNLMRRLASCTGSPSDVAFSRCLEIDMSVSRVGFWGFWVLAAAASATPAWAQPGGGRGGFGRGGGMTGLLRSDAVQAELEITEEQLADLQAMGEEMREKMRSKFEGMRDLPREERGETMANMREEMRAMQSEAEQRMGDILLPHQVARLKEINLQQQIRGGGLQRAMRGPLAEELGITEEQQEQMATKAQELQAEMEQKIQQLRNEAREELMNMLTPEQRSKLETMIGSDFEMPSRDQGRRFGGGQRGEGRGTAGRGRPQTDE